MSGYNGYTNYETWTVCLWVDNDYGMYCMKEERKPFTAESAAQFCFELFPQGTKDMDHPADMAKVNWQEVADDFNAE